MSIVALIIVVLALIAYLLLWGSAELETKKSAFSQTHELSKHLTATSRKVRKSRNQQALLHIDKAERYLDQAVSFIAKQAYAEARHSAEQGLLLLELADALVAK